MSRLTIAFRFVLVLLCITAVNAAFSDQSVRATGTTEQAPTASAGQLSQEWAHSWGGAADDGAGSIAQDSAGNTYVTGRTESFGQGNGDVLLLNYDARGNLVWARTWGGSGDEAGYGVAVDQAGGIYVAGRTSSFGSGWFDALLLKFDSSGTLLWARTWGGGSYDVAYD